MRVYKSKISKDLCEFSTKCGLYDPTAVTCNELCNKNYCGRYSELTIKKKNSKNSEIKFNDIKFNDKLFVIIIMGILTLLTCGLIWLFIFIINNENNKNKITNFLNDIVPKDTTPDYRGDFYFE